MEESRLVRTELLVVHVEIKKAEHVEITKEDL